MPAGMGIGVDVHGAPAIDPTENVKALVQVEKEHIREVLALKTAHAKELREADIRFADMRAQSETRRLDDLAVQRLSYDKQISDMLAVQVKTTSDLISSQLDKVTAEIKSQIAVLTTATQTQFNELRTSLGDRIAQVERFRYEWGGRAAVSDPATAEALREMAMSIRNLRAGDDQATGRGIGRGEIVAWIAATLGLAVGVAALFVRHV